MKQKLLFTLDTNNPQYSDYNILPNWTRLHSQTFEIDVVLQILKDITSDTNDIFYDNKNDTFIIKFSEKPNIIKQKMK